MNKVAIFTINDDNNYGNRLQNYAVQEVLKKLKFDAITVKNNTRIEDSKNKIRNFVRNFKYKKSLNQGERTIFFNKFNEYIQFYKKIYNIDNISKFPSEEFKYCITGSDQVWNPNLKRTSKIDYLEFTEKNKKIAVSASFGVENLREEYQNNIKILLDEFKAISVREDAGKKIVEDLTGRTDVEVLVDPTMLLSAEEWDKVSKRPKQLDSLKSKKYILNYFLGELPEEWKNEIDRVAKENDCEVINILDKNSPFYVTGPSEFLYLEKNAFMVCTDSFHSSVFSIIYDTPFVVFDRKQNGLASMNSRIDTLLSKFNLQDRRFAEKITDEFKKCDYSEAKKILENEKKKSINFLKRALDINE